MTPKELYNVISRFFYPKEINRFETLTTTIKMQCNAAGTTNQTFDVPARFSRYRLKRVLWNVQWYDNGTGAPLPIETFLKAYTYLIISNKNAVNNSDIAEEFINYVGACLIVSNGLQIQLFKPGQYEFEKITTSDSLSFVAVVCASDATVLDVYITVTIDIERDIN